jgi:(4-(4-[2-(gamma-L-glutamylamino)ethyl]phenoxymethyl)furan-2-yl)methanamine synthase
MNWLGLDIGGANLKAADGRGWARSWPFALWREPERLANALEVLAENAPARAGLAVTMTGELCDCFRTKSEGVRMILSAVNDFAAGRAVQVYLVDGRFATLEEACELPHLAAASNWHALATFACRFVAGESGLLIDIGSTTTDIIPLEKGRPAATGMNDTERLMSGELVYSGVGRTPVCAVVNSLRWRGKDCPVAAELFATTADAYVALGEIVEQPDVSWTADGRPLTREFARERLARMICADRTTFDERDARDSAEQIRVAQMRQLGIALQNVLHRQCPPAESAVISGAGEFLARALVRERMSDVRIVSLSEELGDDVSACAPAHAVSVLASG